MSSACVFTDIEVQHALKQNAKKETQQEMDLLKVSIAHKNICIYNDIYQV